MTRDEMEKLLKPDLIELAMQQQDTIDDLRARLVRTENSQVRVRDEQSHARVSRHKHRSSYDPIRKTKTRTALIIIAGVILTIFIVLYMNGYLYFLLYLIENLISKIL